MLRGSPVILGRMPERPIGTGCKPVGESLRRFESCSAHFPLSEVSGNHRELLAISRIGRDLCGGCGFRLLAASGRFVRLLLCILRRLDEVIPPERPVVRMGGPSLELGVHEKSLARGSSEAWEVACLCREVFSGHRDQVLSAPASASASSGLSASACSSGGRGSAEKARWSSSSFRVTLMM